MAVGEYISVSSQRDSEQADIDKERVEQSKGVCRPVECCCCSKDVATACSQQNRPSQDSTVSAVRDSKTSAGALAAETSSNMSFTWITGPLRITVLRNAHAGPEAQKRELLELQAIYRERGLSKELARQVTAHTVLLCRCTAAVPRAAVHVCMKLGADLCQCSAKSCELSDYGLVIDAVAAKVAVQLSEKDVIRAHARDELGIDMDDLSNPWSAAGASAVAFVIGAGAG